MYISKVYLQLPHILLTKVKSIVVLVEAAIVAIIQCNIFRDTSLPFFAGGIFGGFRWDFKGLGGIRWDFRRTRWVSVGFLWSSVGCLPFCCSVWECGATFGLLFLGDRGGGPGG